MKTVRIQEKRRSQKSLIDAKEAFLLKLSEALDAENSILGAITREKRDTETKEDIRVETKEDIHLTFGYFDNFVRHVNDAHRHRKNAEKIQTLIDANTAELAALKEAKKEEPPTKTVRTLDIHFRNGVIKPTEPVPDPNKYHWEMQSNVSCHPTSWSQIGATGDTDIRPNLSSGEVRLSYKNGDLISNKIRLLTVIKRQAAAAKRRQYRYERDDPAFVQRCKGVAGRIKRMLKPGRLIADANFATRVFQDRVSQLPGHLELDPAEIVALCETGTPDNDDYVHMIEFVEPTVYLNPRGLHDALTDIYEGRRVALRLPTGGRVEDEETKDEEDILERTRRQGILDKKRRQAERMKRAAKLEADKLKAEARRAAAELERQRREEEDRQRQADREAEEARQRQLELERVERERLDELARIEREKAQAEEERQAELERIQKEQEEAAAKAAEEAAERERERKRLQRQAEIDAVEYTLPDNFVGFIQSYATKKEGVADIGPSEWFKVNDKRLVMGFKANDKIYTKSATGKSTRASTIEKANEAGWYEKSTLDAAAAAAAAAALAAEEARIAEEERAAAEEAAAERERLEQERLQKEAEAAAERERLEQERLQKEAEAAAERERIAQEAAAAAAEAKQAKIDVLRGDNDAVAFIRYVFTTYDTNANQEIDELELVRAYFAGKTKVKAGAGAALIEENDQDGDGTINVEEFIDWCATSGVMDDDAWQTAARDFKERQAALSGSGEQKSGLFLDEWNPYDTLVVNNNKPYLIGEVDTILSKIGSSTEWSADNEVRELAKKITNTYAEKLAEFLEATGASKWLDAGDVMRMSKNPRVRIFYVPERPDKGFAFKAGGLVNINARAICTMEVEENTFKGEDGSSSVKSVFVLKDIATKDRGAKFLFADALRKMKADNSRPKMVITQPFADDALTERVERFTNKWGFKPLETERPPPIRNASGLFAMSDTEDLLPPKPGELSAMIQNMADEWVSSDEELMDFAEASEAESMEFAASSSLDTDSDLDFAQSSERSAHPLSSEEEESSEKGKTSSGMEFAESSAAETDSDMEFAETSDKTSSGLEFAESSAVESD